MITVGTGILFFKVVRNGGRGRLKTFKDCGSGIAVWQLRRNHSRGANPGPFDFRIFSLHLAAPKTTRLLLPPDLVQIVILTWTNQIFQQLLMELKFDFCYTYVLLKGCFFLTGISSKTLPAPFGTSDVALRLTMYWLELLSWS